MSWKYQFKVVIVKIFKSTEVEASVYGKGVGKERDPRRGRLEPWVWSREKEEPEGGGGAGSWGREGCVRVCVCVCVCVRLRTHMGRCVKRLVGLGSWWSLGLPSGQDATSIARGMGLVLGQGTRILRVTQPEGKN